MGHKTTTSHSSSSSRRSADRSEQQLLAAAAAVLADEAAAAASEAELLPLLQKLLLQGSDSPVPTAAAAAADSISITSVTCPFSEQELQQIISENAYGESAEDLGAALLRELDPEAVAGLWLEYALLNHSCVPNTLAVCVGRYLLLHVTAAVMQGEELTCR
jgi:SET and MYND domain-containing protein